MIRTSRYHARGYGRLHHATCKHFSQRWLMDHARPWSTKVDHGRPWSTKVDHGRQWSTNVDHCRQWSTNVDHGRPWSTMVDHGRPMSPEVDHDRPWSTISTWTLSCAAAISLGSRRVIDPRQGMDSERSIGGALDVAFGSAPTVRRRLLAAYRFCMFSHVCDVA